MDAEGGDVLAETALLKHAVAEASVVALRHFANGTRQWSKPDGSPVSDADIETQETLLGILRDARPHYGWMAEEDADRRVEKRIFVVDPIDGTRGFLRGERYWSVVAAVVEDGRPIAAVVAAPALGAVFAASIGHGAEKNDVPLKVADGATLKNAMVAMPTALYREGSVMASGVTRAPVLPSLAMRLMNVAQGRFDAVIAKAGAHHWDLAAPDLILCEAGGVFTALSGDVLRYDTMDTSHGPIVAAAPSLAAPLRDVARAGFLRLKRGP